MTQIRLKDACDFFQFILATNRTMKYQYLTYASIKSHAVQFKALKDSKEVGGLSKLIAETDVLSWVDTANKYLLNLLGQDHSPLGYLTQDNVISPATTDDLLPGKCYLQTYKSLTGEIVGRKDHNGTCVETDKVALFLHLEKSSKMGHMSRLYNHTKTPWTVWR